jgi:hypothetical protein
MSSSRSGFAAEVQRRHGLCRDAGSAAVAGIWFDHARYDDFGNASGIQNFLYTNIYLAPGSNYRDQIREARVKPQDAQFEHRLKNNWSPRFGFAWSPGKSRKWSVRGGVGLYNDWITLGESIDRVNRNPPNFLFPSVGQLLPIKPIFAVGTQDDYPYGFPLPKIPSTGLDSRGGLADIQTAVGGLDPGLHSPRTWNFLAGVERELPKQMVAGLTYSGSYSTGGIVATDFNRVAGDLIDGRQDRDRPPAFRRTAQLPGVVYARPCDRLLSGRVPLCRRRQCSGSVGTPEVPRGFLVRHPQPLLCLGCVSRSHPVQEQRDRTQRSS